MTAPEQGITWHVETHEHRERSVDWFWALGLLALAAAALAAFFGNYMLSIIMLLGAGSLGVLVARGPREHSVHIDKHGVSLDGTLYPYRSLHSFWVEEESAEPRLFLSTSGLLSPHITVPLGDRARAAQVRQYLRRTLEEEEQGPHIGEHLAEMFGL